MSPDVHALTGAYVLHAVTGEEHAEFERHLAECVVCRQEVAELRDTATRLGLTAAADPPRELKTSVLDAITRVRQDPPDSEPRPLRLRRWLPPRLTAAAAAVLLVAATVLGVLLVRARQDLAETRQQADTASSILRAGDARVVSLDGGDNGRLTVLASRSQDRMLLLADGLADPPSGRDFQVWKLGPGTESAGILTPRGGRATLAISGTAAQLAITVEPAGGSAAPTANPILAIDLPA